MGCGAHLDFDYENDLTCHYRPKLTKREMEDLSPTERKARQLEQHKHSQRKRRDKTRADAVRLATEHGDPLLATEFDKTLIARRRSHAKAQAASIVTERRDVDPLYASSDMGQLLCFYLHFFLGIIIPPNLSALTTGEKVDKLLVELRRGFPDYNRLYTVRPIYTFYIHS